MHPLADQYFEKDQKWKAEYRLLREIVCQHKLLTEDFKWMHPCYTYQNKNVVLIHGFKEYCALLFPKGALLKDPKHKLIQQTENVQAARQIRFKNVEDIQKLKDEIAEFIHAAIEVEKSGKKVTIKPLEAYPKPKELLESMKDDKSFKQAFHQLSEGRQKAYLYYFNQAKQSKTIKARIEKYYSKIMEGKGLND